MSDEEMSRWMEERVALAEERKDEVLIEMPEVAALERYLRMQMPDARDLAVRNLERIAYGAAREHYGFEASWVEAGNEIHQAFVLLRSYEIPEEVAAQYEALPEPDPRILWVLGRGNREGEFRILRFLEQTSVPAPRARWLDLTGDWLQRPFTIHERVPGRVAPSFTLLGMDEPGQREAIARQFVEILASVHHVEWRAAGLASLGVPPVGDHAYVDLVLGTLERRLDFGCEQRPPPLQRAMEWLSAKRPTLDRVRLVHGDYKTDNLIFEGGRIRAIIDWEFAHLGDPLEDVGAACMGLHATNRLCMGLLPREELLERYARASGEPVDPLRVEFWEIAYSVRMTAFAYSMRGGMQRRHAEIPPELRRDDEF
jgi:aminoglycoside phosphotransferase (APT) family kinase protein